MSHDHQEHHDHEHHENHHDNGHHQDHEHNPEHHNEGGQHNGHHQDAEISVGVDNSDKDKHKTNDPEQELKRYKEEAEATIKFLQTQIAEKETAILGAQDGYMKIISDIEQAAQNKVHEFEQRIKRRSEERDLISQQYEELKEKYKDAVKADEKVKQLTEEKEQQQAHQASLIKRIEEADRNLKEIQENVGRAHVEKESLKSRLESYEAQIAVLQEQLSNSYNGVDSKKSAEVLKKLQDTQKLIETYESQIKVLQQRLDTVSEEKGDLLGELTQDDDSLHTMTQIHSANAQEIELLRKLIQQHDAKQKQLEQRLLNEISVKGNILRDLEAAKTQLRVKDDEIKRVQTLKSTHDNNVLRQKDAKITELEHNIGLAKQEINVLHRELDIFKHATGDNGAVVNKQIPWAPILLVPTLAIGVGVAYRWVLRK